MNSSKENKPLIFISHAAEEDKDIAEAFQHWLNTAYKGRIKVFVSSTDGIHPTEMPSTAMQKALDEASVLLVLHTPNSTDKHWITYESGWAMGGKKISLHLLCKGASVDGIAAPIKTMSEIKNVADENHFKEIISVLNDTIGICNTEPFEQLRRILCDDLEQECNINHPNRNRNKSRVWWAL